MGVQKGLRLKVIVIWIFNTCFLKIDCHSSSSSAKKTRKASILFKRNKWLLLWWSLRNSKSATKTLPARNSPGGFSGLNSPSGRRRRRRVLATTRTSAATSSKKSLGNSSATNTQSGWPPCALIIHAMCLRPRPSTLKGWSVFMAFRIFACWPSPKPGQTSTSRRPSWTSPSGSSRKGTWGIYSRREGWNARSLIFSSKTGTFRQHSLPAGLN